MTVSKEKRRKSCPIEQGIAENLRPFETRKILLKNKKTPIEVQIEAEDSCKCGFLTPTILDIGAGYFCFLNKKGEVDSIKWKAFFPQTDKDAEDAEEGENKNLKCSKEHPLPSKQRNVNLQDWLWFLVPLLFFFLVFTYLFLIH